MTPENDNPAPGLQAATQTGERILDHNRQQLSALMDGALSPDEARFLLRRLRHDEELADCWTRWQVCGDVLRGQACVLASVGFSQRVAVAIAAEAATHPVRRGFAANRWARWGGGAALAASVAVFALFVTRQAPDARLPGQDPTRVAPTQVVVETPTPPASIRSLPPSPSAPDTAAQLAAAVAVAAVPRRVARRSRGQSQRAAIRTNQPAPQAQVAVAAAGTAASDINPFAPRTVIQSRPWPRALLPASPANSAFTVEYGSVGASSFYPFASRPASGLATPANPAAADDGSQKP